MEEGGERVGRRSNTYTEKDLDGGGTTKKEISGGELTNK